MHGEQMHYRDAIPTAKKAVCSAAVMCVRSLEDKQRQLFLQQRDIFGKWRKMEKKKSMKFDIKLQIRDIESKRTIFESVGVLVNYVDRNYWKIIELLWSDIKSEF